VFGSIKMCRIMIFHGFAGKFLVGLLICDGNSANPAINNTVFIFIFNLLFYCFFFWVFIFFVIIYPPPPTFFFFWEKNNVVLCGLTIKM
jgi:hypothetical protein